MQRKLIITLISLVLSVGILLVSFTVFEHLVKTKPQPSQRPNERPALLVKSLTVEPQTVVEPVIGFGTAYADRQSLLSAQVMGEIIELDATIKAGVSVTPDEVLLRIDPHEYEQLLQQAESQLASQKAQLAQLDVETEYIAKLLATAQSEFDAAQWEFNKVAKLFHEGAASQREYEQAKFALEASRRILLNNKKEKELMPTRRQQLEAAIAQSRAQVDIARLNLRRCTIRAPFAGVIQQLYVELGDRVQPGRQLLSLLDPHLIEVAVELPVSRRQRIELGADCRLSVDTMPEATWKGTIARIAPSADEATRTFEAYVEVDNRRQTQRLMPGYFVRAEIDGPVHTDAILLPRGVAQNNRVFIYNNKEGKIYPRYVQIRRHLIDRSIVTGLQPGDTVITSNLEVLHEGMPVRLQADEIHAAEHEPPPTGGETDSQKS